MHICMYKYTYIHAHSHASFARQKKTHGGLDVVFSFCFFSFRDISATMVCWLLRTCGMVCLDCRICASELVCDACSRESSLACIPFWLRRTTSAVRKFCAVRTYVHVHMWVYVCIYISVVQSGRCQVMLSVSVSRLYCCQWSLYSLTCSIVHPPGVIDYIRICVCIHIQQRRQVLCAGWLSVCTIHRHAYIHHPYTPLKRQVGAYCKTDCKGAHLCLEAFLSQDTHWKAATQRCRRARMWRTWRISYIQACRRIQYVHTHACLHIYVYIRYNHYLAYAYIHIHAYAFQARMENLTLCFFRDVTAATH